jgi:DNA-binding transcriptional ArsR family regulator
MALMNGTDDGQRAPSSRRLDRAFRLLAAPERRVLLSVLQERDGGPVDVSTLARDLSTRLREHDPDRARTPDDLQIALHHVHLPKLEAAGVVEWSDDRVRLVPDEYVDRLLSFEREQSPQ